MVFKEGIGPFYDRMAKLGDYHPYRRFGGRNPSFDVHSGRILDVKDNIERGIAYFQHSLDEVLIAGIPIAIVPSHDPEKTTGGLRVLAQRVAAAGRVDATGCLVRTTKIEKLAHGGDRSVQVHLSSIVVQNPELIQGKDVLVLDDVSTSGNSLIACETLLMAAGAARVQRLSLGQTV
jgi:hypothetical protein